MTLFEYDTILREEGYLYLAGIDEAGRGPLAGPVYAAAVILPPEIEIEGLDDSKKLTDKKRDILYDVILEKALATAIIAVDEAVIDEINILQATMQAMKQAVEALSIKPQMVIIDGNTIPKIDFLCQPVIKGDAISASIAAASVLAKVARDRFMMALDKEYPQYGFAKHKGYPTKAHYDSLDQYGPSPVHRESFLKKWRAKNGK